MKKEFYPVVILLVVLFTVSVFFNYLQSEQLLQLQYRLQKLEAGPWKSLFDGKPIFPREQKHKEPEPLEPLDFFIT